MKSSLSRLKFANNLKYLRVKKGVTPYRMAIDCSLSYSYLKRLESGEMGNPSMETIDIIVAYFGVEPFELFL